MLTETFKRRRAAPEAPPCGAQCPSKIPKMAKLYEKLLVITTLASCSGRSTLAMLDKPEKCGLLVLEIMNLPRSFRVSEAFNLYTGLIQRLATRL
jgi:hypothetical protein